MRVLIVEDELRMAELIHRGLAGEGLAADIAVSGGEAVWMAQAHDYDVLVLDVMLPDLDGFEACRRLRRAGVWSPVLMLTARDAVEDRVAGLDRRPGPRQRRRRLSGQAVRIRRAAGTPARADEARRRRAPRRLEGGRSPS
jgi:CheY-like chemotaxis protein